MEPFGNTEEVVVKKCERACGEHMNGCMVFFYHVSVVSRRSSSLSWG